MTLYQELPKASIESILKRRFSDSEIISVKEEITELLYSSSTLEELYSRIGKLVYLKSNIHNNGGR